MQVNLQLLETLLDLIPYAIWLKNLNGEIIYANKAYADYVSCSKEEKDVVGKTDVELYPDNPQAKSFIEKDRKIIASKKMEHTEATFKVRDGRVLYMESIKAPIIDENGEVWGIVGISRDITERKKLEYQLREIGYTDRLTGLYNRAYFEEYIKYIRCNKRKYLSIIMGDLNGLKVVNDTWGHLEGDRFIVKIASIIKSLCRESDAIFRWGGDEITILLPDTDEKTAEEISINILNACKEEKNESIPISIALGIATINDNNKSIDVALKEAEDKLYRNKLLQGNSRSRAIIESLKNSLYEKHKETEIHTERVIEYSNKIGKEMGLSISVLDELELIASLHDIGKIGIPEEILTKQGKLTNEEFDIMKTHVDKGFRIAQTSSALAHISRGILTHHERYDGTGYPLGLKGEEIPLTARIVSIADSYDAMISHRVYRKAMSKEAAIEEIRKNKGTQFDPKIAEIFIRILLKE